MLSEFLAAHREGIKRQSREVFLARWAPLRDPELETAIDAFLDQMIDVLASRPEVAERQIGQLAAIQGSRWFSLGLSVSQLVHAYGTAYESVIHQASRIEPHELEALSEVFDVAIAEAVTEYENRREMEQIGVLAHELKNALSVASTSFDIIKKATVGLRGRTADVLDRSISRMRDLIDRALAEVRLGAASEPVKERLRIEELLDELGSTFQAKATSSGVEIGMEVDPGLEIETDRQLVTSILSNLVLNALKYTRMGGHVLVRAFRRNDHAVVEVEDECGGLPPGKTEEIFMPFVRRTVRPGVGLGLPITVRAAKALGGEVRVHDLPGKGCVFTAELPRELPSQPRTTPPTGPATDWRSGS